MPYEITFHDNPCGISTRYYGTVTEDDLFQCSHDRIQSPERLLKLVYVMDDFSETVEANITPDCLRNLASFAMDISAVNKNISYVAIVPAERLYFLAKLWKLFSRTTEWDINIVKTRNEAEKWIKTRCIINHAPHAKTND